MTTNIADITGSSNEQKIQEMPEMDALTDHFNELLIKPALEKIQLSIVTSLSKAGMLTCDVNSALKEIGNAISEKPVEVKQVVTSSAEVKKVPLCTAIEDGHVCGKVVRNKKLPYCTIHIRRYNKKIPFETEQEEKKE